MQGMRTACAVAVLMISVTALGQSNQFASELQGNYARLKVNILKAADKMPPADYSFKPTPDIRTYARVVNHVTEAQLHICGAADNVDASALPKVPRKRRTRRQSSRHSRLPLPSVTKRMPA